MIVLLDESVPKPVEEALEDRGLETERTVKGRPDSDVIQYAVKLEAPVLTRDQGDFPRLNQELAHHGIIIDRNLHLRRDLEMVSQTVEKLLIDRTEEELRNNIWYLTNFYGR